MATASELHPIILHRVQASMRGDSARRVAKVCRRLYSRNGATFESLRVLAWAFFRLEWLMWPLLLGAGNIHPLVGLPTLTWRASRMQRTRCVIGSVRRAASVLP